MHAMWVRDRRRTSSMTDVEPSAPQPAAGVDKSEFKEAWHEAVNIELDGHNECSAQQSSFRATSSSPSQNLPVFVPRSSPSSELYPGYD